MMEITEIVDPVEQSDTSSLKEPDTAKPVVESLETVTSSPQSDDEKVEPCEQSNLFGKDSAEFLKEKGNLAFKEGDFIVACELYTGALLRLEYSDKEVLKSQLHANRAACHIALEQYDLAINDTTDAILLDSSYVKAYLRRSTAFEKKGMMQKASADLEKAIQLDPSMEPKYKDKVCTLKALAQKEFEKEKDEMIGKLKEFGNTLLGKVGLSLDNFKVNKDEATGSYNIQFQN